MGFKWRHFFYNCSKSRQRSWLFCRAHLSLKFTSFPKQFRYSYWGYSFRLFGSSRVFLAKAFLLPDGGRFVSLVRREGLHAISSEQLHRWQSFHFHRQNIIRDFVLFAFAVFESYSWIKQLFQVFHSTVRFRKNCSFSLIDLPYISKWCSHRLPVSRIFSCFLQYTMCIWRAANGAKPSPD